MFIKLCKKRGQNTAEYAILIGVIVAAAIAMQVYVRRGMQARVRDAVDFTREANTDIFNISQYEPYYQCSFYDITQSGTTYENLLTGGGVSRNVVDQITDRSGNQVYLNYATENVPTP